MMHIQLDVPQQAGSDEPLPSVWTTSPSSISPCMIRLHRQQEHHHQSPSSEIKEGGTFPVKLYNMLGKVRGTVLEKIINWDPDGMSFVIYKPKEFANQLMGIFFKQTKYKSFQRQLNFYGFIRTRRGIIRGVYSHPLFQRDKPHLCQRMRRMDVNKNHLSLDAIRQQNVNLRHMNHHHTPSSSSSSLMRNNQLMEYLLEPSLVQNMPNISSTRRLSDDDSIETIDELPFGCAPCFVNEDESF